MNLITDLKLNHRSGYWEDLGSLGFEIVQNLHSYLIFFSAKDMQKNQHIILLVDFMLDPYSKASSQPFFISLHKPIFDNQFKF